MASKTLHTCTSHGVENQQLVVLREAASDCAHTSTENDVSGFAFTLLTLAGFVSHEYSVLSKEVTEGLLIKVLKGTQHTLLILCTLCKRTEAEAIQKYMQCEKCSHGMLMSRVLTKIFSLDISAEDPLARLETVLRNELEYERILHLMIEMKSVQHDEFDARVVE